MVVCCGYAVFSMVFGGIMSLDIIETIDWAMNTIRDRVMFGLDDLNAAYSRERRAKGALGDAKKVILQLQKKNKELTEALQSIAFVEEPEQSSMFYWLKKTPSEMATTLSNDTFLAREVLKKVGEL